MEIKELHHIYLNKRSISTDTRSISKGCIFFALKGDNFNGNSFAQEAISKGAVYSVIDEKEYKGPNCILVPDVLQALQNLANYHRKYLGIPVIGITGSNGKTTTKELMFSVLNSHYKTYATKGNLNNHIGVPLTLLSIDESYKMAIVEMGANHQGEIHELCTIAEPDYGLITNVGKAHLEGFGSFEGVIKTKTELYRFVDNKKGKLFINSENSILSAEASKSSCDKILYGNADKSFVKGEIKESNPFLSIEVTSENNNRTIINSHLAGTYNRENILSAVCAGLFFNVPLEKISEAIANYRPENNRSQLTKTDTNILLCDYYNANPSSMEAALQNFHQTSFEYEHKVLMLGGMKELGQESEKEHEKIIQLIKKLNFKEVYLTGNEFRVDPDFKNFQSSEDLAEYLKNNKIKKSAILIKGSRGSKMELVVPFL